MRESLALLWQLALAQQLELLLLQLQTRGHLFEDTLATFAIDHGGRILPPAALELAQLFLDPLHFAAADVQLVRRPLQGERLLVLLKRLQRAACLLELRLGVLQLQLPFRPGELCLFLHEP